MSFSSAGACANVGANFTITSGTVTCTVKYDQAGNGNFNAAPQVIETVNAQKANQTITFGALANKNFGDADLNASATASSSLAVSFTASGQCTVSTNTVHLAGAGSCTITAKQTGDNNFNAATDVTQSFNVGKASPTTTVSSSLNPSNLTQNVTFTATVTSPVVQGSNKRA